MIEKCGHEHDRNKEKYEKEKIRPKPPRIVGTHLFYFFFYRHITFSGIEQRDRYAMTLFSQIGV